MRIGYHRWGKRQTDKTLHEGPISVGRAGGIDDDEDSATYTLSLRPENKDGASVTQYVTITGAELARLCRIRELNARTSRPS